MREVICGPFHSGHRKLWAAALREEVRLGEAHKTLYLVPTRGLAGVVRRLVLEDLPGMAGEQVLTLFEVVEDILQKSKSSYIRLDGLAAERLVAKAMRSLAIEWNGKQLADWSHSPGVVAAFRRHIGELKRARIEPSALVSHAQGTREEETMHVLAAVYAAYQQELGGGALRMLDTEETYLEAARLLEQKGLQGLYPGVETVSIDAFTDFQPHQMAVVLPLLQAQNVQVYVPYQPERWAWMENISKQMHGTVERYFQKILRVKYEDREMVEGIAEDLLAIQARLFAPNPEPVATVPHVNVFCARTAEKEWLWVAKRVKALHQQGVPLNEIAILTNRTLAYGSTAHRVLQREGVPVQQAVSLTAEQVPWVRDLLALYTLEDEGWHRDVLQQLAGADWLLGDHLLRGRETVPQRVAKQFGIVKGLDVWRSRVTAALARLRDGGEEERADLEALLAWLGLLAGKVQALPKLASGQEHVQAMRGLLEGVKLYERLVERYQAGIGYTAAFLQRDLRARDALLGVLGDVEKIERSIGDAALYSQEEFVQVLWSHLRATEMVIERGKRYGVAYLNASAARGLSFAHVFFVGLNEGEWPTPSGVQWLMRESLREELAEQVPLLSPQVQTDQQKLFFLMGLHTARVGVSLSYVGGSKQDLPSRFLDQLFELCPTLQERMITDEYLGGSALYPQEQEAISNEREARDWLAEQWKREALSAEAMLLVEPEFWQPVLAQAQSELARAKVQDVNPFDGLLGDEGIRGELAARFSEEQIYSVSQFNRYGECGYKFYLSRVLKLEPEQEEEEELSALEKGNLYHKVLNRLYQNVVAAERITAELVAELRGKLELIFEEEWSRSQRGRQTEVGKRQLLEKEQLLRRLRDWLAGESEAWMELGLPLKPAHLEWAFGMKAGSDNDPQSIAEPITVGKLKFRGQIDRIDATPDGQFLVVDYKTKNTKSMPRAIENGVDFQLPVYVRAVEQALFPKGAAIGAAYYSIEKVDRTTSALVKEEHLKALGMGNKRTKIGGEQWDELLATTERTLETYRQRMAEGRFPVLPSDEATCSFCEYRHICRYDRLRALSRTVAVTKEEGGNANG